MLTGNNLFRKFQNMTNAGKLNLLALVMIVLIGAFLRFYQLGASSIGNEYYAAAVKSMLTSWHNFFFVAFEPGGSVSVDKPPLGLWLEAASAFLLGMNGFALAFPNALAGTLSILVLFSLVKKQFGWLAGLIAALVLAVTPVTIATERNNTMDGMLVFVLLLATWAVWKSIEKGRFAHFLLGMVLVGLGFNIKMLQALMILPALFAVYFFGAKSGWLRRVLQLGGASLLLLVVSLAWPLVVDATPANSRPYIGSSSDNTVMELMLGHNGLKRLVGGSSYDQAANYLLAETDSSQSETIFGNPKEIGSAGLLRLLTEPLAAQVSWLLPLGLLGAALTISELMRARWPVAKVLALLLWLSWLLPMLLYFTFTDGLWHAYYLIMLGPALAALVGVSFWSFEQLFNRQDKPGLGIILVLTGITLGFEISVLAGERTWFVLAASAMLIIWLAGQVLLWARLQRWAFGLLLLSLLVGPLLWSGLTTFNPQPEVDLPVAGPFPGRPGLGPFGTGLSSTQQALQDYLLANNTPQAFLAATLDSHGASPFILNTGRAFLTLGGYIGKDNVISLAQLQAMIQSEELRYVVDNGNLSQKEEISTWVQSSCAEVQVPGISSTARKTRQASGGPRDQQFSALYDCGAQAH